LLVRAKPETGEESLEPATLPPPLDSYSESICKRPLVLLRGLLSCLCRGNLGLASSAIPLFSAFVYNYSRFFFYGYVLNNLIGSLFYLIRKEG
jgi:hypothetical protein